MKSIAGRSVRLLGRVLLKGLAVFMAVLSGKGGPNALEPPPRDLYMPKRDEYRP